MTQEHARQALDGALEGVRPLVTLSREGLAVTALTWDVVREQEYLTAETAARDGTLELHEVGAGTVPAIEAATKARPVVLFAGDTVEGGKQNRIINVTVWLAPNKATAIPVSCLEHGRWNAGHTFAASRKVDYALRAAMSDQLADVAVQEQALASTHPTPGRHRSYRADQGAVWAEIAAKEDRAGAYSGTGALHDLYSREADDLRAFVAAFRCPPGASGVAIAIGGVLTALELFDAPATLAEQWPRLIEGAASADLDHRRMVAAAVVAAPRHRYPDDGALGRMLQRARAACAEAVVGPSVGEGVDVRLRGHKVRGGALLVDGMPVHVELFRAGA